VGCYKVKKVSPQIRSSSASAPGQFRLRLVPLSSAVTCGCEASLVALTFLLRHTSLSPFSLQNHLIKCYMHFVKCRFHVFYASHVFRGASISSRILRNMVTYLVFFENAELHVSCGILIITLVVSHLHPHLQPHESANSRFPLVPFTIHIDWKLRDKASILWNFRTRSEPWG
jgi:hypothetical protein